MVKYLFYSVLMLYSMLDRTSGQPPGEGSIEEQVGLGCQSEVIMGKAEEASGRDQGMGRNGHFGRDQGGRCPGDKGQGPEGVGQSIKTGAKGQGLETRDMSCDS